MSTTDPTTEAVRTVARRVLVHIIAANEVLQKWEDYPEIGEDDWVAVAAEVWRLAHPADRRPVQPLSQPGGQKDTQTVDGWRQIWRQYGWIDHKGRMYDLAERAPSAYRVASFSPLWVLVDNEPIPGPDPATTAPATPGQLDLDQIERTWLVQCGPCDYGLVEMGCNCPAGDYRPVMMELVREVRRLTAAPGVYQLPAEPPASVTELWEERTGCPWTRDRSDPTRWTHADTDDPIWRSWPWLAILSDRGPLSTTPPAGTGGEHG